MCAPWPSNLSTAPARSDFIRDIVAADVAAGRVATVVTRFPPEPNGYLHIGHAKSICLNFGVAAEFGGHCNLRFDDTNPIKEEQEYIDAIEADVRWLGFDWGDDLYHASDYFEQLYEWAVELIRAGKAYVDDLTADEIREYRGTLTEPGRDSPWRDRPVDENLDLFARMRAGEFPNGARVLRAKIDMASPNINLRDPVLYRIVHATHPRTGDAWCIYPTYDFAHGQSDAIEGVTHSLCTLEFEAHRPLYDWLIDNLPVPSQPRQIEFARLNLTYTVLSKRVLLRLVNEGHVRGWDDPRMPTISGLRRRGFPAEGIRDFATMIGVAKADSVVEIGLLEHAVRDVLNRTAPRRFGVLDPLKVVIENYPEGQVEEIEVANNPEDPAAGHARACRSRASCGSSARTSWRSRRRSSSGSRPAARCGSRSAYFVTCTEVVKDADGQGRRAALHVRPGDARRRLRPTAAGRRRPSTGSRRRTRCRPRCGSTTTSSARPGPGRRRATCSPTSTRRPRRSCRRASSSRRWPSRRSARPSSSSGSATSAPDPDSTPGAPGLQPDADAQGHLGEGAGPRLTANRGTGLRSRVPRRRGRR